MPLNAWTRGFGYTQGRIRPQRFVPPEGFYSFGMGNDLPGTIESLKAGANIEVFQSGLFKSAVLMRFKGKIRPPKDLPVGAGFEVAMLVNGVEKMSQAMRPGWNRTVFDWAVNVSKIHSTSTISWRLTVTGTPGEVYQVELPAFYVDAISFETASPRPLLINRVPEPNETQVPLDANIQLDITDVGSSGIDSASASVYVRGVLAFSGGTFQSGFAGPDSISTAPQADTLRVIIDPEVANQFQSEEVVTVRVVASLTGGGALVDQSYTFTAVDMTAPRLVSATAVGRRVVRLSFSEPILEEDALGLADGLNLANYSFARLSAPAASLYPVSIAEVSNSSVDITVQWPMTPNAVYEVIAELVQDLFGNVIASPFNAVPFLGFAPPVPAGRRFSLWDLMPDRVKEADAEQGGFFELFLGCLQEPIDLMIFSIDQFFTILNPDLAPEEWLDIMLQDLGNPFPTLSLSFNEKQKLLSVWRTAINESGSDPGIERMILILVGLVAKMRPYDEIGLTLGESLLGEDWELGASGSFARYAFDAEVFRSLTADERTKIRAIVEYMKAGWTHFITLKEPTAPTSAPDHLELGVSELGESWILH